MMEVVPIPVEQKLHGPVTPLPSVLRSKLAPKSSTPSDDSSKIVAGCILLVLLRVSVQQNEKKTHVCAAECSRTFIFFWSEKRRSMHVWVLQASLILSLSTFVSTTRSVSTLVVVLVVRSASILARTRSASTLVRTRALISLRLVVSRGTLSRAHL